MTLKFISQDGKDSVECKGLCYGEIMVLLCRILCDDAWKYQVKSDDAETSESLNKSDLSEIEYALELASRYLKGDSVPEEVLNTTDYTERLNSFQTLINKISKERKNNA